MARFRFALLAALGAGAAALAACGETPSDVPLRSASCAPPAGDRVHIRGGTFTMGSDSTYPEEGPAHEVRVGDFWMDRHEVTNRQFAAFVAATDYRTVAERSLDPADYPGAPPETLQPGSAVFVPPLQPVAGGPMNWWRYVAGASWRQPQGPSGPAARPDDPVVHIALEDAQAYADWAGARLPTEAEWEFAARAGSTASSTEQPKEANSWQGMFPYENRVDDGFPGVAPVGCFEANAYGLSDMIGNVWEWTASPFAGGHGEPTAEAPVRVIKGGSYLCAPNYCMRYRPEARHAQDTGMGASHIGFRTVSAVPPRTS